MLPSRTLTGSGGDADINTGGYSVSLAGALSGPAGLDLRPIDGLSEARRPRVVHHILGDGNVLYDCDLSAD